MATYPRAISFLMPAKVFALTVEALMDSVMMAKTAEKYVGLGYMCGKVQDEGYRIKRYVPGGGEYFKLHVDCNGFPQAHRQLVLFMYLNTVEIGGETEFPTQGISVKPVEGRMVTFPPFWTHAHIGHPPVSENKYAVTAWITFPRK